MREQVRVRNFKTKVLQPHIEEAEHLIGDYNAIMILSSREVGSGTFLKIGPFYGILTAHHTAMSLFSKEEFTLCVSNQIANECWGSPQRLTHIPIGPHDPKNADGPDDGPDLSFLAIHDRPLKEFIEGHGKRFFDLISMTRYAYEAWPFDQRLKVWGFGGSADDSLRFDLNEPSLPDSNEPPLSRLLNLAPMLPTWDDELQVNEFQRGDFDYLKLRVPSGKRGLPYNYGGLSGGGFWVALPKVDASGDPESVRLGPPLLVGAEFSQSGLIDNSYRILTGHGLNSIYRKTVEEVRNFSPKP
jgi:hypothetical protein